PDVEHRRVVRGVDDRPVRNPLHPFDPHWRPGGPEYLARPVVRPPVVHATTARAPLDAQQRRPDDPDGVDDARNHEYDVEPQGTDHRAGKWSKPGGGVIRRPLCVIRRPRPDAQRPMCVSGSPVARRNARAPASPKLRGNATSSSYSSPLPTAASGATRGQHGTRSSAISMPTPDAAARCPASPANPSERSIMARAPRRASQRP